MEKKAGVKAPSGANEPPRRKLRGIGEIEQKRANRESVILVTGGTGFIGSHLAVRLCRSGYHVIVMARPNRQMTGGERMNQLLRWFGATDLLGSRFEILEGRIDQPDLGLGHVRYKNLAEGIDEIVHCASNTSFSERKRDEVENANTAGVENVLALASKGRCAFFHHMSTAYVAGGGGLCKEELVEPTVFNNVYEETKWRAEWIAAEHCSREGIRLSIYRPSIVYGDSATGRTIRFNALYFPVKAILFLKDLYERDIRENSGSKAAEMGIRIGPDGLTHMPIRIEAHGPGGLNLIPIDYCVEAFMAVMEDRPEGGIFHIVNTRTTPIGEIIGHVERFFGIEGIRAVSPGEFRKNSLEVLFEHYVRAYGPYIKDTRTFENSRAEAVLKKRGIECPDFNYDIFSRCMSYALDMGWGARMFARDG